MPAHFGESVVSHGPKGTFEVQNPLKRRELTVDAEWRDELECFIAKTGDGGKAKISLDTLVSFVVDGADDPLSKAIDYILEPISKVLDYSAYQVQTTMIGNNFVYATGSGYPTSHLTIRANNDKTVAVTFYHTPEAFAFGEVIEINDRSFVVTCHDMNWETYLITMSAETDVPTQNITLIDMIDYLKEQGKLVEVSSKPTRLKADDAAGTLRRA